MPCNVTPHNSEYRDLPVTALTESASNPRKRFDENSLSELAASLKTQGVLAPLLVRELEESNYEVIAGARRIILIHPRRSRLNGSGQMNGSGSRKINSP